MDNVRDTVTVDSLLTTSDNAYSKVNINSGKLEKEEGDIEGPFDLGVSLTETLEEDKTTQIIYYTTANLMDSQINQAVAGGNEKMIMESLGPAGKYRENRNCFNSIKKSPGFSSYTYCL